METLRDIMQNGMLPMKIRKFAQHLNKLGPKHQEMLTRVALTFANLETHGGDVIAAQIKTWWNMTLGVDPIDHSAIFTKVDSDSFAEVTGERVDYFKTSQDNMVAHTEGEEGTHYAGLTFGKRSMTPTKTKLLYKPTYEFLQKMVRKDPTGTLLLTVMSIMYRRDATRLFWQGDTDSTNRTLSIYDGICKRCKMETTYPDINKTHSDAAWAGTPSNEDIYTILGATYDCLVAYKEAELADRPDLVWIMNKGNKHKYQKHLRALGNGTLESGAKRIQQTGITNKEEYEGIPIEAEPYFPANMILLTEFENLKHRYVDVPEKFLIESDKNINAQYVLHVLSTEHKVDVGWEPLLFPNYHSDLSLAE